MTPALKIDIDGDIFSTDTTSEVIVVGHGVNVRGVMGAGFAALVANKFPEVKKSYQDACSRQDGLTTGSTQIVLARPSLTPMYIANIASQHNPGADAREEWLEQGLKHMYAQIQTAAPYTFSVRLPLIGGGIGGLTPAQSIGIISRAAEIPDFTVTTTLYLRSSDSVYGASLNALQQLGIHN